MPRYSIFIVPIRANVVLLFSLIVWAVVSPACRSKKPDHPVQNPPKAAAVKKQKRLYKWFPFLKPKDEVQQSKQNKVKSQSDGFGAFRKNKKKKRSQIEHGLFPKDMKW